MERVFMVGLGDLGGKILEILARVPRAPELIVGDIDEEGGALNGKQCSHRGSSS